MSLRQKVLLVSREDLVPYPPTLVMKRYSQAVLSGLRNNNIRNQLRPILEIDHLTDEFLLETLTKAVAEENEHCEKFTKKNSVNSISTEHKTEGEAENLSEQLKALK